mmetsp:Transcript_9487/g.16531  ORF Transcript_9487/g.16531 Transcript_9487/m.16531 type:complete len:210 (+) Transcript_9487:696-1325(+)
MRRSLYPRQLRQMTPNTSSSTQDQHSFVGTNVIGQNGSRRSTRQSCRLNRRNFCSVLYLFAHTDTNACVFAKCIARSIRKASSHNVTHLKIVVVRIRLYHDATTVTARNVRKARRTLECPRLSGEDTAIAWRQCHGQRLDDHVRFAICFGSRLDERMDLVLGFVLVVEAGYANVILHRQDLADASVICSKGSPHELRCCWQLHHLFSFL